MRVIAESGMIYTMAVLVTFLVSASRSNAVYIAADMASISLQIYYFSSTKS
jgi:hypothetical protein